jgi:hypothetical protein
MNEDDEGISCQCNIVGWTSVVLEACRRRKWHWTTVAVGCLLFSDELSMTETFPLIPLENYCPTVTYRHRPTHIEIRQ